MKNKTASALHHLFTVDDDLMERARATVAITNAIGKEDIKMAGFLALFHPELDDERRMQLIHGARRT